MSLSTAPLTHRPCLSRLLCPSCQQETLHRGYRCLHCFTNHPPPKSKRPAYGARLVIAKYRENYPPKP